MKALAPVLALAIALLPAVPARAQELEPPLAPARFWVGLYGIGAQPAGEFDDFVDFSLGVGGQFRYQLSPDGPFALRLDLGVVNYGSERQRVPLSNTVGGRVTVDLVTDNNIFFAGAGPMFVPSHGSVRPYVGGLVGLNYLFTRSRVENRSDGEDIAAETNFDDAVFSYGADAGVLISLSSGKTPVLLKLGGRWQGGGEASYLREGGIIDNPDGSITFDPVQSRTNMVMFEAGVTVGIR